jgi:hypothetical protein
LEIWKSRIDHSFTDLAGRKSTKTASFSRFPYVYPKNEQEELTSHQRKLLSSIVREEFK